MSVNADIQGILKNYWLWETCLSHPAFITVNAHPWSSLTIVHSKRQAPPFDIMGCSKPLLPTSFILCSFITDLWCFSTVYVFSVCWCLEKKRPLTNHCHLRWTKHEDKGASWIFLSQLKKPVKEAWHQLSAFLVELAELDHSMKDITNFPGLLMDELYNI